MASKEGDGAEGYMKKPLLVFCSYAHEDESLLIQLRKQLSPLIDSGHLDMWYDRKIVPGEKWSAIISDQLEKANIFLPLISADFLSSGYCRGIEMQRAMEREKEGSVIIIPIIVRCSIWDVTDIAKFYALPKDGKAITLWDDQDEAWADVAREIQRVVDRPPFRPNGGTLNNNKQYIMKSESNLNSELIRPTNLREEPPSEPSTETVPAKILHNIRIKTSKPTNIVGRDEVENKIIETLTKVDKPVIIVSGFGGVGKSTVAQIVAWKCLEDQEPFDLIAWIDCRLYAETQSIISFNYILNEIANVAHADSEIISISLIELKKEKITEILKRHRSLLIFDNYEHLLDHPTEEEQVSSFIGGLPISPVTDTNDYFIRVLITTREKSKSLNTLPIDDVQLESLNFDDALLMMQFLTPNHINIDDDQYKRIWEILCGLPKYMEVAIDQLKKMPFEQWERNIKRIKVPLTDDDKYYNDLFKLSWERFDDKFKKILLSITYFVGEVSLKALQHTCGLTDEDFDSTLASESDAFIKSTGSGFNVHSLTHAFCRSVLQSSEYIDFKKQSSIRFVEYFLDLTKNASECENIDSQEVEIRNIVAAAKLTENLQAWDYAIELRNSTMNFLRHRGYWNDVLEISKVAVKACRNLGRKKNLADCLVNDLGWLCLRFENIVQAEEYINEGLILYQELHDKKGEAQAARHLGKAALIKGLDEYYLPNDLWQKYSKESKSLYQKSLDIRESLLQEGHDQRTAIADMKLDFGRFYWLDGKNKETDGREQNSKALISESLQAYELANKISREAMALFEETKIDRGIAKAWGNLGNTTKEIVKFELKDINYPEANKHLTEAFEFYEKNLQVAKQIKRKDEIAHALWGLAEVYELYADNYELHKAFGDKKQLLSKALEYAKESNGLYTSLGGTRDNNVIRRLVNHIHGKLFEENVENTPLDRSQREDEPLERISNHSNVTYNYNIHGGTVNIKDEKDMSTISVQLGNGTVIHGDLVVANKIKDNFNKVESSNISKDLKDMIKDLANEVGKMSMQLPKEKAIQVVNDLQTLTNEATSKKPRKKLWELSGEGIKEAAESVGVVGKTVLRLLKDLIPILDKFS